MYFENYLVSYVKKYESKFGLLKPVKNANN